MSVPADIALLKDSSKPPSAQVQQSFSCWVLSDGRAGMENQCLGLAAALSVVPEVKRIRLRSPLRQLTPWVRIGQRFALTSGSARLAPPWPDLVIASGRASIAASLWVKKKSGGRTRCVQIQNPVILHERFDLIVTPRHDGLTGKNIVSTLGGLHRVTPALLAQEAARFPDLTAGLPRPLVAVLIGGNNGVYHLRAQEVFHLAGQLSALCKKHGAGLLITPSRRTGAANIALLHAALHDCPAVIWDGHGQNPYYAMLAAADHILVTCDSVNMASEAASTGKPVQIIALPGGSEKFHAFHEQMEKSGHTRPFRGALERWDAVPLDEMSMVAAQVRALLPERPGAGA